jgi:hypothetical protein
MNEKVREIGRSIMQEKAVELSELLGKKAPPELIARELRGLIWAAKLYCPDELAQAQSIEDYQLACFNWSICSRCGAPCDYTDILLKTGALCPKCQLVSDTDAEVDGRGPLN